MKKISHLLQILDFMFVVYLLHVTGSCCQPSETNITGIILVVIFSIINIILIVIIFKLFWHKITSFVPLNQPSKKPHIRYSKTWRELKSSENLWKKEMSIRASWIFHLAKSYRFWYAKAYKVDSYRNSKCFD